MFVRRFAPAILVLLYAARAFALDPSRPLTAYGRQTWRTDSGLPQNTVRAILQTHNGFLWLATEGGLVRFDGLKFVTFDSQTTPELRSNNIRALAEDEQHALWIGTADGLSRFDGSTFQTLTTRDGLPSDSILALETDGAGKMRISTSEGNVLYNNGRFENASNSIPAHDPRIISRFQDRQGVTWEGTDTGISRIRNGVAERFPPGDPLSTEAVLSMTEDREGDLWIGTDSDGVTVLRDQKFTSYTSKDGLPSDQVRCVFEDRRGRLWVGTEAGLARLDSGRFSVLTTANGLSSNVVLSLAENAEGNLLVGTPNGLNILTGSSVKVLTSADGLPDDYIRSIYLDKDGSLWIGTRHGLAHSQGSITTYTSHNGLESDLVGVVTRDNAGALWVGTLLGLSRLAAGRFVYSFGPIAITALQAEAQGALWIGTGQSGLYRLEREKVISHITTPGLPNAVLGILPDDSGRLWVAANTGIFRVNASNPSETAQFTAADGLPVSECSDGGHPGVWRGRDGTFWFSMSKGLASIRPNSIASSVEVPIALESVLVDDRPVTPEQARNIAPGHTRLSFEYAGLSFASPLSVRYKYKLDGFDKEWIDAGTRRTAFYTNIPPGTYTFHVFARTNTGTWSKTGARFAFRLRPHFYQTYVFYLLVVIALLLLMWRVYLWRVSQVKVRYDAVAAERTRIAREIHDTLAQGYVALSLQLELVSQALSTSKEAAQDMLAAAQDSVRTSLGDARRSIWELRSYGSGADDLASRLAMIAAQVNSTTSLKAELQVFGTRRALSHKVEHELLKIGQEAVANAVRHADASDLHIDLSYEPRQLTLAITDNGRGFTPASNGSGLEGHYGLRGMKERADQIRARLRVESAPGKGAQILVQTDIE
ncbi:MAG TPA: two-component regulator propeller domain-containing protein [Bryobacteraceae bacterium]|nr:two-component regulator propeller domain-containing protein [Bryobacteraceae bacterium]